MKRRPEAAVAESPESRGRRCGKSTRMREPLRVERDPGSDGESFRARVRLRLTAAVEAGTDTSFIHHIHRSWHKLVLGLASQEHVWLESWIEKRKDGKHARCFWNLSCHGNTAVEAKRHLLDSLPHCERMLRGAEQYFRFEKVCETTLPAIFPCTYALDLGRRLQWLPTPTGRTLLLPCPWIPTDSTLADFLQALDLQPGPARLVAAVRRVSLTREEQTLLGCDGTRPAVIGYGSRRDARPDGASPISAFELRIRLETVAAPSPACMYHMGVAITEQPGVETERLGEHRYVGGFIWNESGRATEHMPAARLYYLYDAGEVLAVFRPPLSTSREPFRDIKRLFPLQDGVAVDTRGSTELGLIAGDPDRRVVRVEDERRREHMFVLGATGTGKSNLMLQVILQSIRQRRATIVMDFHGDLCEAILARLGRTHGERLVYFNAADTDHPIGLNLLASDGDQASRRVMQDRAIQSLLALFKTQFGEDTLGPIFQMNIKNAIYLALANPEGATLLDVAQCFIGPPSFREKLLAATTNPLVRNFWRKVYEQTTEFHKSEFLQYVISKLTPLVENEILRNIVGQRTCLNVHRILAERQILLCNLNRGLLGEQHAALLATILTQKLEEACYARATEDPDTRDDVFVYFDEVHNLAGENVARLVSEARKFGVCLMFSTQVLELLESQMRHATLGNAATLVCFRLGTNDASIMDSYFCEGLDPSLLTRLPHYHAAVRLISKTRPQYAVIETLRPGSPRSGEETEKLRQLSRERHGRPRREVEQEIFRRLEEHQD